MSRSMPAACPTCGTDNRDSAMFCRGCLAKLPAFAPTAPSMLESIRASPADAPRPRPRGGGPAGAQAVASWMVFLGVLLLVGVSALVVWAATSARVPHMQAPSVLPQVQAAVAPPPRMRTEEEREVLTAAHLVPKPEATWDDKQGASQPIPLQALTPDQGVKSRPARVATTSGAKPRKENRRLIPVVAATSGARAACDRYNPYGEVLCTQGGYPYRTWSGRYRRQ